MNRSIRLVICLLPLLTLSTGSFAATLEHDSRPGNNYAKALFRFWCPDDLAAVRGVVVLVPGSNGDGRGMVSDADWQKFACQHQLALVGCWFQDMPHEKYKFIEGYALASKGSGQALLDALNAFAATSQHDEVASVPLVLWGQSAGGQFNYEFTCWKPERVLAFVVNKGGIYYTHLAPEAARRVPGIFFIGENDLEFRKMSLYGIYAVNRRAHALWTLAVEPKAGHGVGRTPELARAFFAAVLPLRQPTPNAQALTALREEDGWVGKLKSCEIRKGKMREDEWSTWLPSEPVAHAWLIFVKGQ